MDPAEDERTEPETFPTAHIDGEFGDDIMLVGELRTLLPRDELGAAIILLLRHSAARIFATVSRSSYSAEKRSIGVKKSNTHLQNCNTFSSARTRCVR